MTPPAIGSLALGFSRNPLLRIMDDCLTLLCRPGHPSGALAVRHIDHFLHSISTVEPGVYYPFPKARNAPGHLWASPARHRIARAREPEPTHDR